MTDTTEKQLLLAAPLQGTTTAPFRNALAETFGGADEYFTPFMRLEHGAPRKKDAYDVAPERQGKTSVVPQILVRSRDEGRILVDFLQSLGYSRVDFNFACPFVKVTDEGYGAATGASADVLRDVLLLTLDYPGIRFSAKIRSEAAEHADVFNDFPLHFLTLHPRTAGQGYKGVPDRDLYWDFAERVHCPVVYNGDVTAPSDGTAFPRLMVGRGMLADPGIFLKMRGQMPSAEQYRKFHRVLMDYALAENGGLDYLKRYWDWFLPDIPKKYRKKVLKSRTAEEYAAAADAALDELTAGSAIL